MCVYHMCTSAACGGQERALDHPLGVELQVIVSHLI